MTFTYEDGTVILRTARKNHSCWGGHDGKKHTKCNQPILKGDKYIEYLGESPLYSSGKRYHLQCAQQQGLVKLDEVAA